MSGSLKSSPLLCNLQKRVKVTFDTNVFDPLVKHMCGTNADPEMSAIQELMRCGRVDGFYSDAYLYLEGLRKHGKRKGSSDRKVILGSRRLVSSSDVGSDGSINITIGVGSDSYPENDKHYEIAGELCAYGFIAMRGIAFLGDTHRVPDLLEFKDRIYGDVSTDCLASYRERMAQLEMAIARRNLENKTLRGELSIGKFRAMDLGSKNLKDDDAEALWYKGLYTAPDKEVDEAVAEWADHEAVIRHYGYGCDLFCTNDNAKGAKKPSILDPEHKSWLEDEFGIVFVTSKVLVERLNSLLA